MYVKYSKIERPACEDHLEAENLVSELYSISYFSNLNFTIFKKYWRFRFLVSDQKFKSH